MYGPTILQIQDQSLEQVIKYTYESYPGLIKIIQKVLIIDN
jgi:hypothetical protein